MRSIIILAAALVLAACAAKGPPPESPECAQPVKKPPTDGGIGGTCKTGECENMVPAG